MMDRVRLFMEGCVLSQKAARGLGAKFFGREKGTKPFVSLS